MFLFGSQVRGGLVGDSHPRHVHAESLASRWGRPLTGSDRRRSPSRGTLVRMEMPATRDEDAFMSPALGEA